MQQQSPNCTGCRSILGSLVKSHSADACPLRRVVYCGLCASYGHSPQDCPDSLTMAYRQPHYVEQLVPPSLLSEFGITSSTPLYGSPSIKELPDKCIMEVPETEEAIRAAIIAAGEKPMICHQKKGVESKKELMENKKKLQRIADAAGKKLVYLITRVPAKVKA